MIVIPDEDESHMMTPPTHSDNSLLSPVQKARATLPSPFADAVDRRPELAGFVETIVLDLLEQGSS